VYFKDTGTEIIILLCAGEKSTQKADIEKAKKLTRRMTMKTTKWDMAEVIDTKEDVTAHLTVVSA
jgi:hypothetical protein